MQSIGRLRLFSHSRSECLNQVDNDTGRSFAVRSVIINGLVSKRRRNQQIVLISMPHWTCLLQQQELQRSTCQIGLWPDSQDLDRFWPLSFTELVIFIHRFWPLSFTEFGLSYCVWWRSEACGLMWWENSIAVHVMIDFCLCKDKRSRTEWPLNAFLFLRSGACNSVCTNNTCAWQTIVRAHASMQAYKCIHTRTRAQRRTQPCTSAHTHTNHLPSRSPTGASFLAQLYLDLTGWYHTCGLVPTRRLILHFWILFR